MTDQVLVNTHSSVMVVDSNEYQQIYCVEKIDKITKIHPIDELEKINIIFDLLGGSPSDLLLPKNFLIVEGRSEYEFLKEIIKRFYPDKFKGMKILFASGDIYEQESRIHAVHRLFTPLAGSENPIYKEKVIVLLDKPNQRQKTKYEDFKAGYPYLFKNSQVFELTKESLEEYYPAEYAKSKGQLSSRHEKVTYAKEVAAKITQSQFEGEMAIMFNAITECNKKAFNPN